VVFGHGEQAVYGMPQVFSLEVKHVAMVDAHFNLAREVGLLEIHQGD
jgi:hypothetical protein